MGIILTACTAEIALDKKANRRDKGFLKVEVADEFTDATTRANYSGFPTMTFETNDAIGVYGLDGSSYVTSNIRFVKQSDGSWLPDEDIPYIEGCTYYAYFPYRSTVYTPSTSGAVDDINTKFANFISDANNYFWQADQSTKDGYTYSNLMIAVGEETDVDDDAVTVKFTLKHKRGLAVFNGEAAQATFTGNIPYLINSTMHFLMKPTVSTSFTDNSGTYSLDAPSGYYVTHNVVLPPIDLSMVDNAGNTRASMTTANCYLIHSAGKYKIPLVYGNAIKNGMVNSIAYNPGGGGWGDSNYINTFVNHANIGIYAPWITKSGSGIDAGKGLTAASAELIWQDVAGLISSVSVDGDYLEFSVGTFNPGNALIAVKDGSGTILWSWHIWATTETLESTTTVATGSHNYAVAPVNLGWVPTGDGGRQGYCPYYQWGRKEPFIPSTGNGSTTNHTVYNISGSSITGINYVNSSVTIGVNIQNPTNFYYNTTTYGPTNITYYNKWDAQNKTTNIVTAATKKTIYDPCPPGFCVPTSNLFSFMANGYRKMTEYDSTGAVFNTNTTGTDLWWPFLNYRDYSNGNLKSPHIRYWSATPSGNTNGVMLNSSSGTWSYDYLQYSYGCPIRPVADEY